MDLTERRRGDRDLVEPLEELRRCGAVLLADDALDLREWNLGNLVSERSQRPGVDRREQVGPTGEHLGHLDERRTESGEARDELLRASLVVERRAACRSPEEQPPVVIAPERHRERQQPPDDHEKAHRSSVG